MVEHSLSTQTTRVRSSLRPRIFIIEHFVCISLNISVAHKMMIFRSQPTTPMLEFLQNELFNAIVLIWEVLSVAGHARNSLENQAQFTFPFREP